ncbi:MAG: hypothetical protein AAF928_10450 [Myxococcota bacterium]
MVDRGPLIHWISTRWVSTVIAGVLAAGCSSSEVDSGTYVARLSAPDAWVAVAIEDDRAVAYTCGAGPDLTEQTRWMAGTVSDGRVVATRDGWRIDLETSDDETLTGSLTAPDGDTASVAAEVLPPPGGVDGLRGLLTSVVDGCRAGVIIDADGSARGAFCTELGFLSQVTPVMPVQDAVDVLAVEALAPEGGPVSFSVTPVDIPALHRELDAATAVGN